LRYGSDGGARGGSGKDPGKLLPTPGSCWKTKGQVLPLLVIGLVILWVALAVSFSLGRDVLQRVQLQMVADLAAEEGASVLAESLNFMATTNLAMLSMGVAAFFGHGDVIATIREFQRTQDFVAQVAGAAALAKAESVALEHGAVAIPLNHLTGTALPSLMVARGYAGTIPVWLEDRLQPIDEREYGERFVRLLVRKSNPQRVDKYQQPAQMAVAEAAAEGQRILGEQIILPLPEPNYSASLVEIKCKLEGVLP